MSKKRIVFARLVHSNGASHVGECWVYVYGTKSKSLHGVTQDGPTLVMTQYALRTRLCDGDVWLKHVSMENAQEKLYKEALHEIIKPCHYD